MKNKTLAVKALKKDCGAKGFYVDGKHTCAIGCLALLAGIPRTFFTGVDKSLNEEPISEKKLKPVREAILRKFGLSTQQQMAIQQANDKKFNVELRREAVLERIERY